VELKGYSNHFQRVLIAQSLFLIVRALLLAGIPEMAILHVKNPAMTPLSWR